MARSIIIDGAEEVACPKCSHPFPLTEGISRQTIERHAEDFERAFAERKKHLEAQLAIAQLHQRPAIPGSLHGGDVHDVGSQHLQDGIDALGGHAVNLGEGRANERFLGGGVGAVGVRDAPEETGDRRHGALRLAVRAPEHPGHCLL